MIKFSALCLLLISSCASSLDVATIPQNQEVIRALKKMPKGGDYSTGRKANDQLAKAVQVYRNIGLRSTPSRAKPSYCSGATYLVLLEMIEAAVARGEFRLTEQQALALMVCGQADGDGVWGRWNANGPGAAKLVRDLGMGINFESYSNAQPGDFMKIFWSDEIGKNEFGHLVVYLGIHEIGGVEHVRFWSSNQPKGYGVKSVAKGNVKWAVFTRITKLQNIKRVEELPARDHFLSSMLTHRYSRAQVRRSCEIN